jgi:hypothetical protein
MMSALVHQLITSDKREDSPASPQVRHAVPIYLLPMPSDFSLTLRPRFCYFLFGFMLESSLQVNSFLNDFLKKE